MVTVQEPGAGLLSPRFAEDETLAAVAAGRLRLAAPGTAPYPAPVRSSGAAVAKVQQALMDLGYALPASGADGRFGSETGAAVARYKRERAISPSDPVVGPQTMARLDQDMIAHDVPPAPVPPAPVPPGPTPVPPSVDPGVARWVRAMGAGMRVWNDVEALIDGPEAFGAMLNAICTASDRSHYIYLLGWWLDLDVPLDPAVLPAYCAGQGSGGAPAGPSSMRQLLTAAAAHGVQIRVMLWDQTFSSQNTPEVGFVNTLPTGAAMLDNNQLNYMAGSQHQKILIVNGSGGLLAFCGGIDMNPDRVCPRISGSSSASSGGAGNPLHDVHCRISGPAADDLLEVFVKRWYANPNHRVLDRAKGPLLGFCQPRSSPHGTSAVRVGETFNADAALPVRPVTNCRVPPPERPARRFRDRSVQEIFLTAIGQARQFIYWEDQYLVNMCAAEALRRALPNVSFILLLIPESGITDMPHRWYRRRLFIEHIRSHPQGAKLRVFTLCDPATGSVGPHTYVHAKTMMVDDELAIIGSANCNRRGWESDTEVTAAIAGGQDATGRSFARRVRQRLWAEHLGVACSVVEDALMSAPLWWLPASAPGSVVTLPSGATVPLPTRRVRPYDPAGGTDPATDVFAPWDTVDPPLPMPGAPCSRILPTARTAAGVTAEMWQPARYAFTSAPSRTSESNGGGSGGSAVAVVEPFPAHYQLPLDMTNDQLASCAQPIERDPDVSGLCGAVAFIPGGPASPAFFGLNPVDMVYVASVAKIYVMYAAFELKSRVQEQARRMISNGLSTAATGWEDEVFRTLTEDWTPKVNTVFPHLPPGFPNLARIFVVSAAGEVRFRTRNPPLTNAELDAPEQTPHGPVPAEFKTPQGEFGDWMRLMLRQSNDTAASRCVRMLSYPYINGALAAAGFFDMASRTGLWISADYESGDWLPHDGAAQPLSPRWARLQARDKSNFTGTAFQLGRFMTMLAKNILVDRDSSMAMLGILDGAEAIGSYIQGGLVGCVRDRPFPQPCELSAERRRHFSSIRSKIGYGNDAFSHDCAVVRVGHGEDTLTYVSVILGSPPAKWRADLYDLAVKFHDCALAQHPLQVP